VRRRIVAALTTGAQVVALCALGLAATAIKAAAVAMGCKAKKRRFRYER
jgi:hypothetical protein